MFVIENNELSVLVHVDYFIGRTNSFQIRLAQILLLQANLLSFVSRIDLIVLLHDFFLVAMLSYCVEDCEQNHDYCENDNHSKNILSLCARHFLFASTRKLNILPGACIHFYNLLLSHAI